jgi:hypothetical protein
MDYSTFDAAAWCDGLFGAGAPSPPSPPHTQSLHFSTTRTFLLRSFLAGATLTTVTCSQTAINWLEDTSSGSSPFPEWNTVAEACAGAGDKLDSAATFCCEDKTSACPSSHSYSYENIDLSCIENIAVDGWNCAGPLTAFDTCDQNVDDFLCMWCYNGGV